MTTDTSERGLERLICTALTGHPCDPPQESMAAEARPRLRRRRRLERRQSPRLRPRVLRRSGPARGIPEVHPAGRRRIVGARRGRSGAAQVPRPAAGRDRQARHHRRAAPRRQTRCARPGPVLRHAVGRERAGAAALRAEPLHRRPAASLQPGRDAAGARHRALHQRPAGLHVRAEEQPHQADGGRRGLAVPEGPQPAREAVRARPLRGPLRGGRERRALLHPPQGEGVLVPAVQPGLERRRRQSAQPERHQDRLPVARRADSRKPDRHPGELRPGGGGEGREDRQEKAVADLAALPTARRRAAPAGRRRDARERAGAT